MSWRESLLPASFRGVAFRVLNHDSSVGGRRVQVHRYPTRNQPFTEDLGRKDREFTLEAFVLGDDYVTQRDQLTDACSADGDGALVHPFLGNFQVVCSDCRVSERTEEGRMARFALTFVEKGTNRQPGESVDTAVRIEETAIEARQTSIDSFVQEFRVEDQAGFVADEAAGLLSRVADSTLEIAASPSTGLTRAAGFMADQAGDLVQNAPQLGEDVSALVTTAREAIEPAIPAVLGIIEQTDIGSRLPPVATSTATRLVQSRNQDAIGGLYRRAGLIEASRSVPLVPLTTQSEARQLRDHLAVGFDAELDRASDAGDDAGFVAMSGLRNATLKHISARAPNLARVVKVTTQVAEPALVAAYRLYEDATKGDEIAWRNERPHPGFLPGGSEIEVLTVGGADG